jgi:3-oxoacyl-[acyl-carrier protein] reductase
MNSFSGKNVLVTGAGVGIGFALCRVFAMEGATVALNDIDQALAQEAARKINHELGAVRVHPYTCDVADVAAMRQVVADFSARFRGLHVVIANAGITNYGQFLTYTPEAFDHLTDVSLRGSYFTAQAGALAMIEHNIAGRILFMSSVTGVQAHLNLSAYGLTKAAIRMMARSLAVELGPYSITVNAIAPGATITERTLADDPNYERNWAEVTPMAAVNRVEDVTAAALFLASPQARHITGETLVIDGGWTVHSPLPQDHPQVRSMASDEER